jgi:cytoskeletal protein RodZ
LGLIPGTVQPSPTPAPTATPIPPTNIPVPEPTNTPTPQPTQPPAATTMPAATATPMPTGRVACKAVSLFNEQKIAITPEQAKSLTAGDKVYFGVSFENTDPPKQNLQAHFRVNLGSWLTNANKMVVNEVEHFIQEFVIPHGVYEFEVEAVVK